MSVAIRSSADIEGIAACGEVVAAALEAGRKVCVAGRSTFEISTAVASVLADANAEPLFIGLPSEENANVSAFPAPACISVDDEVIHGIHVIGLFWHTKIAVLSMQNESGLQKQCNGENMLHFLGIQSNIKLRTV